MSYCTYCQAFKCRHITRRRERAQQQQPETRVEWFGSLRVDQPVKEAPDA